MAHKKNEYLVNVYNECASDFNKALKYGIDIKSLISELMNLQARIDSYADDETKLDLLSVQVHLTELQNEVDHRIEILSDALEVLEPFVKED